MKKYVFLFTLISLISHKGQSQTYVSGGIFSNTTWTVTGSPYVVTGNVVVFPGVVLTIQPGVTVKFNSGVGMEIRQGDLIAIGNASNHIVFTSSDSNPVQGSWDMIFSNSSTGIQIKYCEFHYAGIGLYGNGNSISVVSSIFTDNTIGMDAQSNVYVRIDSCVFRNNATGQELDPGYKMSITNCSYVGNSTGLHAESGCSVINCIIDSNSVYGLLKHMACGDTIRNNAIRFNGAGISHDYSGCGGTEYIHDNIIENNTVGIVIQNTAGQTINVYHNVICSNTLYNFQNLTTINIYAANNCWCSGDSAFIASTIYDAYDNASYGIVDFTPMDTTICQMTNLVETFSDKTETEVIIYPNPFSDEAILKIRESVLGGLNLMIYDSYGRLVRKYSETYTDHIKISKEELSPGVYFYHLQAGQVHNATGKFSIE